jgi:hypothetical protein
MTTFLACPGAGTRRSAPALAHARAVRQRLAFVAVEQHSVAGLSLLLAQLQAQPDPSDLGDALAPVLRVPRPPPVDFMDGPPLSIGRRLRLGAMERTDGQRTDCRAWELQKLAGDTLAFYPAEKDRLRAIATRAAEAARSRRRRLADSGRGASGSRKSVPAELAEVAAKAAIAQDDALAEVEPSARAAAPVRTVPG